MRTFNIFSYSLVIPILCWYCKKNFSSKLLWIYLKFNVFLYLYFFNSFKLSISFHHFSSQISSISWICFLLGIFFKSVFNLHLWVEKSLKLRKSERTRLCPHIRVTIKTWNSSFKFHFQFHILELGIVISKHD